MNVPVFLLSVGASLGAGALSAPAIGAALSKPITGEIVPTRITDLGAYLFASGGVAHSGKGLGFEDTENQISVGEVSPGVPFNPDDHRPQTAQPTPSATVDQKRILAVTSLGGALVVSFLSFVIIGRVMRAF